MAVQETETKDLLAGTKPEDEKEQQGQEQASEENENEEESEHQEIKLDEQISAIQDAAIDGSEKIAQYREDANYLLKQMDTIEASQFEKGALYDGLQPLQMDGKLIYQLSNAEIDRNVSIIENSDLSAQDKRSRIRLIDSALVLFKERKEQMQKLLKDNLKRADYDEWQQVESSFTHKDTGFPELKEHIPAIWEFCKSQMDSSPSLKAKCEASIQEKVKLTQRAIKELGIDKKLGGASENERSSVAVPAGNAGKQPAKRGSKEPTFTRAQLRELMSTPGKVDSNLLAQINKAAAEGRIKE